MKTITYQYIETRTIRVPRACPHNSFEDMWDYVFWNINKQFSGFEEFKNSYTNPVNGLSIELLKIQTEQMRVIHVGYEEEE